MKNIKVQAIILTSILFMIVISFIIFNALDPILYTEENIVLTPEMNKLLVELEQKYR